ncbi:hypothetical protein JXJ21_25655 [candidate division KSB1 bacterium]|nr:hypothetical protein [candidate division KSB1 bacterium]
MSNKKRAYAIKFDSFEASGKKYTLWIMPAGGMQILIENDGVIVENITSKGARLTPLQFIEKYLEMASAEGMAKRLKEVDAFENTEKNVSLWMTSNDKALHIIVSNDIVEDYVTSRDNNLDESRIAQLFEEIKSDLRSAKPDSKSDKDPVQEDMFSVAA